MVHIMCVLHQLLHMVRTLDQDNTRLRNNVIECNDEIFTLKAVAASVEAELRYSTEQELLKIGSELKFRVSYEFHYQLLY